MFSTKISLVFVLLVSLQLTITPQIDKKNDLRIVTDQKTYTFLDINNIATYFYNNGISDNTPTGNSGFVYPKGTGKTAVFTSGLLWGAKVAGDPNPRVGGSAYRTGLKPGNVSPDGTPADPTSDKYRIYRVRKDVYPNGPFVDLISDALNETSTTGIIRTNYEKDWTEWPADLGAPFDDKNNNGIYEPSIDVPGVPGADQTIWFVANDLDSSQSQYLYGSNPLGVEMQATIWAYNQTGPVGNMLFRKYKLINKTGTGNLSPVVFDSMYISMWTDVDLGDAGDDFVGTDSVLSLIYTYNANETDATYNPLPPPAVGFNLLQGPIINGVPGQDLNKNGIDDAIDFGIYNGQKIGPGKINLPMTTGYAIIKGTVGYGDPIQGDIRGAREFYNFFQGLWNQSGEPFINPLDGTITKFIYNGDPQKGTGWLDGLTYLSGFPAGDRRNGCASGPFTIAPGDTNEVIFAEIIAGAEPGSDRLSAIGNLKANTMIAKYLYDNNFDSFTPPSSPKIKTVELDRKIILDWGEDRNAVFETESKINGGYSFQGYNVYQLPSPKSAISEGKRIATFDRIDGVRKILEKYYDPVAGEFLYKLAQFGNDSGIQHSITITVDSLHYDSNGNGLWLINGLKYYFAVTAYSYNPGIDVFPNNLESEIQIITVRPHIPDPGITLEDPGNVILTKSGTATISATVKIINPDMLTGHNYEIFFNTQDYISDVNGNWTKVFAKPYNSLIPNDVSPSTLIFAISIPGDGSLNITASLSVISPDYDYADGVKIDFPTGVTINSAEPYSGCAGPVIAGQSILWGDSSQSKYGCFQSTADLVMNVTGTLPFDVNWTIYDDALSSDYPQYFVEIKNAYGTATLGFPKVTQKQWGVKDITLGTNVLENQTVFGGIDKEFGNGPGGSSGLLGPNVGTDFMVQADGLGFRIDAGSFSAPLTFDKITYNGFTVASNISIGDQNRFAGYNISEFGALGYPDARASTSFPLYGGVGGTSLIEELQKDYELRWTGVKETITIAGKNVIRVASGGSMATLFGASLYDIKNDPANPNPGSSNPFLLRIPFEVWNIDDNQQVNLAVWHRQGDLSEDPFQEWKEDGRMYAWIINTEYDDTVPLDITAASTTANATWNVVFFSSEFYQNDIIGLVYANPIQPGKDSFTFSTISKKYSLQKAKKDVEKINVFPNPYYAKSTDDLTSYDRFITFTHLPVKAKIRIFNLGGHLVRVIDKDDNSQYVKWDLLTLHGYLAGSGIYIAYIELPDLGTTKILKLAIVQGIPIINYQY